MMNKLVLIGVRSPILIGCSTRERSPHDDLARVAKEFGEKTHMAK